MQLTFIWLKAIYFILSSSLYSNSMENMAILVQLFVCIKLLCLYLSSRFQFVSTRARAHILYYLIHYHTNNNKYEFLRKFSIIWHRTRILLNRRSSSLSACDNAHHATLHWRVLSPYQSWLFVCTMHDESYKRRECALRRSKKKKIKYSTYLSCTQLYSRQSAKLKWD